VRQDHRAANDLIGLLGIDPQTHVNLNRLVELRVAEFFQLLDRGSQGQRLFAVGLTGQSAEAFGLLRHMCSWSVISCQLSVGSCQLSVVSFDRH